MIRPAKDIDEKTPWQEMTLGGEIYEGATARHFKTGDWRTQTPVYHQEACRQCLLCCAYCPDSAIPVTDGLRGAFDLDHCKGCGICAEVCHFDAITFAKEGAK